MAKFYRFMLQPYRGPSTRHRCPKCGDLHSFTYYIDTRKYQDSGEVAIYSEDCGRCDNENTCGYIKYPQGTEQAVTIGHIERKPPVFYTREDVKMFAASRNGNNLVKFLLERAQFDSDRLRKILVDYCIGSTSNRGIVFWQIDHRYNIHRGKIMWYREDGHREKYPDGHGMIQSMWKLLDRDREVEPEMCYFGQHLITLHPEKPIALVESEKTCIIASYAIPEFNWVATMSINNFQTHRLGFLNDYKGEVYVFPDCDGFDMWAERVGVIRKLMPDLNIRVNSFIKKYGRGKEDLADVFLRWNR